MREIKLQMRFWGIPILLVLFPAISSAQKKTLTFNKESIKSVLQTIEAETDFIFNYDPELLEQYSFSGKLNLTNQKDFLAKLFYGIPFQYDISEEVVLIYATKVKDFRICGTVLDQQTKRPLLAANIYTDDYKHGTQSNSQGYFELNISTHKNQIVTISYIGFQPQSFAIKDWDIRNCPKLELIPDENLFGQPIIVKDYILDGITEGQSYSSVQIDYNRLTNWQSNIEQDILKTVQLIPGITSVDESATNLQIRGNSSDQNLILWEGATLYDPGHLFGMISAINPFVVERVKVFKGVFEPSYDNRVGGIIDMSLSDSIAKGFSGGIGSTFSEAHAFLHVPVFPDRLSILVSGRNTINQIYRSPTLSSYAESVFQSTKVTEEEEDRETDQLLDFYDWNAKLLFTPSDGIFLKASYFKSFNQFNFSNTLFEEELESNDEVKSASEALSISLTTHVNQNWQAEISFTNSKYQDDYQFDIVDLEDDVTTTQYQVFNNIKDQTLSISNQLYLHPNWNFSFGYEFDQKAVNFNFDLQSFFEQDFEDVNFAEGHFHNGFVSFQYAKNRSQINGGLRSTYYEEVKRWAFSPRLNVQIALNDALKWKFSTGIFQQYISQLKEFGENDLGINNPTWVISLNETNSTQEASKIATGLVFRKGGWLIDMEGYYHKTTGLNTLSSSFGQNGILDDFSPGSSTAMGIDFLGKKRWAFYSLWINYSLSKVSFSFPEITEKTFPAVNDHPHNLSLINNWKYKNWNFSLTYQFRSGLPFSQPDGLEFIMDDENDEAFYELEYNVINEARLDHYNRLDLGINYKHTFKSSKLKLELALSVINLFNWENRFSRNYYLAELDEMNETPEVFFVDTIMLKRTLQVLFRIYW